MAYFSWDPKKEWLNRLKHGVDFSTATQAFFDPHRRIAEDPKHSGHEKRQFCFGVVEGRVLTVRFLYRKDEIRIIGAGYWRKGRRIYEEETQTRS